MKTEQFLLYINDVVVGIVDGDFHFAAEGIIGLAGGVVDAQALLRQMTVPAKSKRDEIKTKNSGKAMTRMPIPIRNKASVTQYRTATQQMGNPG